MRLCEFGENEISAETFIELLGQRAELRNLEVTGVEYDSCFLQNLRALLLAVEKSQLDSFAIGTIYDEVQFQYLIQSIPKMKVRLLRFYVVDEDDEYGQPYLERFKIPMMAALKNNLSIDTLDAQTGPEDDDEPRYENLFSLEEQRYLNHYGARNKGIAELISSPSSFPRGALPYALVAARKTGSNTVYRILSGRAGALFTGFPVVDTVGSVEVTRMRGYTQRLGTVSKRPRPSRPKLATMPTVSKRPRGRCTARFDSNDKVDQQEGTFMADSPAAMPTAPKGLGGTGRCTARFEKQDGGATRSCSRALATGTAMGVARKPRGVMRL
jgi:hypothetical protein